MFSYSFLNDFQEKFLLLEKNVSSHWAGELLNNYIFFNAENHYGSILNTNTIENLAEILSKNFNHFLNQNSAFKFKKGKITIFLYTIVRCEKFNILFVYSIKTRKIKKSRETWLKEYNIYKPTYCCLNKFKIAFGNEKLSNLDSQGIETILEKFCVFPKQKMISTSIYCTPYFLKKENTNKKNIISNLFSLKDLIEKNLFMEININGRITTPSYKINLAGTKGFIPDCSDIPSDLTTQNIENFLNQVLKTSYLHQVGLFRKASLLQNEVLYVTIENN